MEQQLIQTNLELANAQSQIEIEHQLVQRLKKENEKAMEGKNSPLTSPIAGGKGGSNSFLKMFAFNKAGEVNESVDYAHYLQEV